MSYDLNVRDDGSTQCTRCVGQSHHTLVERVEEVAGVPFWRNIRRYSQCRSCSWWTNRPVDPVTIKRHPRTRGVTWRIVVSWALLAAMACVGLAWFAYSRHLQRSYAEAPEVGDRWTIATGSWPGDFFENAAAYGVARVTAVDAREVALAACSSTSDEGEAVRDHCKTFKIEMAPVAREDVSRLFDSDAIDDIERAGDKEEYGYGFAALAFCVALLALHRARSRRFFASHAA